MVEAHRDHQEWNERKMLCRTEAPQLAGESLWARKGRAGRFVGVLRGISPALYGVSPFVSPQSVGASRVAGGREQRPRWDLGIADSVIGRGEDLFG